MIDNYIEAGIIDIIILMTQTKIIQTKLKIWIGFILHLQRSFLFLKEKGCILSCWIKVLHVSIQTQIRLEARHRSFQSRVLSCGTRLSRKSRGTGARDCQGHTCPPKDYKSGASSRSDHEAIPLQLFRSPGCRRPTHATPRPLALHCSHMAATLGFRVLTLTALLLLVLGAVADDGYFIKAAAKSVPRIGRRGDFYIKAASKSVPRMGKKNNEGMLENVDGPASVEAPKPVYLVRYARRGSGSGQGADTAEASLSGQRENWLHDDVAWKDIDRVMEERPELWRHLLEGAVPPSSSDIDTDTLWRRHFEE